MAEKGQTEANCNLENTNRIANEVGKRREEAKGKNHISDAKDFQNAIDHHEQDPKISREVTDSAREGRAYCNLGSANYSLGDFRKAIEYHEHHRNE